MNDVGSAAGATRRREIPSAWLPFLPLAQVEREVAMAYNRFAAGFQPRERGHPALDEGGDALACMEQAGSIHVVKHGQPEVWMGKLGRVCGLSFGCLAGWIPAECIRVMAWARGCGRWLVWCEPGVVGESTGDLA